MALIDHSMFSKKNIFRLYYFILENAHLSFIGSNFAEDTT